MILVCLFVRKADGSGPRTSLTFSMLNKKKKKKSFRLAVPLKLEYIELFIYKLSPPPDYQVYIYLLSLFGKCLSV